MAPKTRLLVFMHLLPQGGAERFTYELLKLIDRDRFDVALLTRWRRRESETDFYEPLIRELGIPIYRLMPSVSLFAWWHRRLYRWLRTPLALLQRVAARLLMGKLLDTFDVISVVQIENYQLMQPLVRDNERLIVHLMSHRFQYRFDPYTDCLPGRRYRFTYFDEKMREEWATNPACRDAETMDFPLSMDFSGRPVLASCARVEPPYRIGVFMRISPERPVVGILEAFRELRGMVDAELWFYGRGETALLEPELERLGIRESTRFRGHSPDLIRTLREDGLAMAWMPCGGRDGTTIGYAAVEIGSVGFPMRFWSHHADVASAEACAATGGAFLSFDDPRMLAEETANALQDAEALRESGVRLRNWIIAHHSMEPHVRRLEEWYERIAAANRRP